ncbi:MAG: toxin-antitoxin system HicB family antitoxin [Caldilineaceae bacterium]
MSVLSVRLPTSVHEQLRTVAAQEGISINQFITLAIAEKKATIDAKNYLQERAKRGSREKLLAVLAKAPEVEPEKADNLPILLIHD